MIDILKKTPTVTSVALVTLQTNKFNKPLAL